jgi:GT2 family glycosyltransferase
MSDAVFEILQEGPSGAPAGGRQERLVRTTQLRADPRDTLVPVAHAGAPLRHSARHAIEAVVVGREGGVLLIGWADDVDYPLDSVIVSTPSWRLTFDAATFARVRRTDVEEALGAAVGHPYGFFGLVAAPALRDLPDSAEIEIRLKNGSFSAVTIACRCMSAEALRDLALGYLASASFIGNTQAEAAAALEPGLGTQLVALNRAITQRITAARHIERFGTPRREPAASIVVCLYGKPEFLFVQNALFAGGSGIGDYEFIYVCNSPEMTDALMDEARAAHMIYGLNMSLVLLPGNAGFGAANNAGVAAALGRRILNINPDVFPRQRDWAARHTALVEQLPVSQTRLFGTTLYYDDGSLMHGGMYFELDPALSVRPGRIEPRRLARVEHYGKGAPPGGHTYTRPRAVPAVTGAFISSDRAWYESLGGFNESYIFGHYEDADLCLKCLAGGSPAWLHDLPMWHLEGKGSTRRVHHEGGSLVNRWLFTRQWSATIAAGLSGPAPSHKLMAAAGKVKRGKV